MHTLRIVPAAVVASAALVLAGCTTTVDGTGSRVGAAPSATDFPSTSSSAPSPTDSPTGSDSPTSTSTASGDADDLVDQMVDAMGSRPQGFTLTGDSDSDGQAATLDLRMAGDSGSGSITIDGEKCEIVNDAGDGYVRASATFWTDTLDLDADVADQMDGRWVQMSGDLEAFKTFVDAATFLDLLTSSAGDFDLGDPTTKQGVDVQTVEGDSETFYISSDEPHLLISLEDDDGVVEFGFPDDDLTVGPPAGSIPYPG